MTHTVWVGDCLEKLRSMKDETVDCCITSPPYYGLRNYDGKCRWWGGILDCGHEEKEKFCIKCGAWFGELGLEHSMHQFIEHLVEIFNEVKRVLKPNGTVWINIGDTYLNSGAGNKKPSGFQQNSQASKAGAYPQHSKQRRYPKAKGLKTKDMCLIPHRLVIALQDDGWWIRNDIIWAKPNPMPESVRDRLTKSHEHIFLLAKSKKYNFDIDAIKEERIDGKGLRNKRDVWNITQKSFKGAHFATYPPDLIEPCVLAGCPVDGLILDPFAGSGTTAGVAEVFNRNSLMIELNPEYAKLIPARIEDIKKYYEVSDL